MQKNQSRNMLRLGFRPGTTPNVQWNGFGRKRKRAERKKKEEALARRKAEEKELKFRRSGKTESLLIEAMGPGPNFALTVYRRYAEKFDEFNYDIKKCAAYLNSVAKVRMLNRKLWTDRAVESMFLRAMPERRFIK